jgi:flavin reductase (DIM6/NTAB) family NADH-FMN oxidoreductase RutF
MECVHHDTVVLPGDSPQGVHHVLIGRVVGIRIDDAFITDAGLVDQVGLRAIARLGYMDYTEVNNVFSMRKRTDGGGAAE